MGKQMKIYENTVKKETFELLLKLSNDKLFKDFFLVGGTALTLQTGYRKSIDIDLFTRKKFNVLNYKKHLIDKYDFKVDYTVDDTLCGSINGVDVDFIKYDYPIIAPILKYKGITILNEIDIGCMKLVAIKDNGTREKDFVDIDYILHSHSLEEMCYHFCNKYDLDKNSIIYVLQGLTYFKDIKNNSKIILTKGEYDFNKVKKNLIKKVQNFDYELFNKLGNETEFSR